MRYESVCLAVNDMALARKFYQELFGLKVNQDFGENISFSCGISLQQDFGKLLNIPNEKILNRPCNMELYFEEDEFDSFLLRLKQYEDIEYLGEGVVQQPWGQRSVRFYDLDGHIIEVGENLRIVVKRFLSHGMTMEETSKRMDVSIQELEKILNSYR